MAKKQMTNSTAAGGGAGSGSSAGGGATAGGGIASAAGGAAGNKASTTAGREHFGSRLGFILISAGCAIGLGNVWKFPYQVGQYGGAAFLLLYILCLVLIGIPLMTVEFAVGRSAQKSNALAYNILEPKGTKWHWFKWVSISGQYVLMAFYTTVCGWMLNYIFKEGSGMFEGTDASHTMQIFSDMNASAFENVFWMIAACLIGMLICSGGVQKGVERVTKVMMLILLVIMVLLAVFALCQPDAEMGLSFYLKPDFTYILGSPEMFLDSLYQAMSLAFFTLSIGMGSMAIFGSYIKKDRALFGEAITISVLDVGVAIVAGLIIFPACFSYGIQPDSGPSLVFVTLPNVFASMPIGSVWGTLFFVFLSFAALSTVIAVFENIIAFWMDLLGWSRRKSVLINLVFIIVISLPCALGSNALSFINIDFAGLSSFMDVEDFIISNNILPLGGVFFALFATLKCGWGFKAARKEINTGKGAKFPAWMYGWVKFVVPIFILFIFVCGWMSHF